jgi:uncharacterized protein YecE (DUF72 family)
MKPVHIGCSGWMYDDWRGRFYPEKEPKRRWLELYAQTFDTVEVNNTFYRLPTRKAVQRWVEQTPERFEFTVKASRYLTHVKGLQELGVGVERFQERMEPLIEARKLGPVLWQLPENFHRDDERLERWLAALPEGRHTIEFRHESWFVPEVLKALRERGVALAIGDHPSRPFQSHEATAGWMFVRFHYGPHGRGGNYSATELDEWARRFRRWRRDVEIYAYFNNDWRGFAPANARTLMQKL